MEIRKITSDKIIFKGGTEKEVIQRANEICHKFKHLYLEGYPCGRKTRKDKKLRLKRWNKCPKICFTYLVTPDRVSDNLVISVYVSDIESLRTRYTMKEIDFYSSMYTQDVAEEIINFTD